MQSIEGTSLYTRQSDGHVSTHCHSSILYIDPPENSHFHAVFTHKIKVESIEFNILQQVSLD